jgi:multiple sugar transport system permease protein
LLLITPWLLGLVVFKLAPILGSLVLSFTNFFLLTPQETQFVGLYNYRSIFNDTAIGPVLLQTLLLTLKIIPLQVSLPILVAAMLNHRALRARNLLRALFFVPSILPSVAASYMWRGFVDPDSGWLNRLLLGPLGLTSLNHLSGRGASQTLFIITAIWAIGPSILINLGAMQGIPSELYEAAKVDGAGRLRRFFHITLPLITPAIFFTLILNLTAVFGGAILLDRGHTFNSNASSFDGYIYYILFRTFDLGYASSLAWFFFALTLVLVLVLFASTRHWVFFPEQETNA